MIYSIRVPIMIAQCLKEEFINWKLSINTLNQQCIKYTKSTVHKINKYLPNPLALITLYMYKLLCGLKITLVHFIIMF